MKKDNKCSIYSVHVRKIAAGFPYTEYWFQIVCSRNSQTKYWILSATLYVVERMHQIVIEKRKRTVSAEDTKLWISEIIWTWFSKGWLLATTTLFIYFLEISLCIFFSGIHRKEVDPVWLIRIQEYQWLFFRRKQIQFKLKLTRFPSIVGINTKSALKDRFELIPHESNERNEHTGFEISVKSDTASVVECVPTGRLLKSALYVPLPWVNATKELSAGDNCRSKYMMTPSGSPWLNASQCWPPSGKQKL